MTAIFVATAASRAVRGTVARSLKKRRPTMTRHLAAFLASLVLSLASSAHASDQVATPARPSVFVVGDSHVRMLGPALRDALDEDGFRFAGYLSRHGWSTLRYRQEGDLRAILEAAGRPEIVVVSLGGNDFVRSRARYEGDLRWIVDEAHAAGAREIVWLGPATSDVERSENARTTGARHERNAELQRELLPAMGVRWTDSRPFTVSHHGHDGVHFTRTGYSTWARGVLDDVEGAAHAEDEPLLASAE